MEGKEKSYGCEGAWEDKDITSHVISNMRIGTNGEYTEYREYEAEEKETNDGFNDYQ